MTELVSMKVWQPFGRSYKTTTISSDLEHIGNLVAEGEIHPSMYWPQLARLKGAQLKHERRLKYQRQKEDMAERAARSAASYASGWVGRWLDAIAVRS